MIWKNFVIDIVSEIGMKWKVDLLILHIVLEKKAKYLQEEKILEMKKIQEIQLIVVCSRSKQIRLRLVECPNEIF